MLPADLVKTNQPKPDMAVETVGQTRVNADVNALYPRSSNPARSFEKVPTRSHVSGSMPFSPGPAEGSGGA